MTFDGGAGHGDIEGPLSIQEWILALELVKKGLLEKAARRAPFPVTGRRLDVPQEP